MRRQQPLHEPTQVPILPRPEGQMKMIRHQAVGQTRIRTRSAASCKSWQNAA